MKMGAMGTRRPRTRALTAHDVTVVAALATPADASKSTPCNGESTHITATHALGLPAFAHGYVAAIIASVIIAAAAAVTACTLNIVTSAVTPTDIAALALCAGAFSVERGA